MSRQMQPLPELYLSGLQKDILGKCLDVGMLKAFCGDLHRIYTNITNAFLSISFLLFFILHQARAAIC